MNQSRADSTEVHTTEARLSFIEAKIDDMRLELDRRFTNQDRVTALALTAAEKTTTVAQETANRAVMKAEAAAERVYMEAQVDSLRRQFEAQIFAQKQAIDAALVAAKDALTSALMASDKAIQKAEEATEKRFESVNEFRSQLADQTRTFVTQSEVTFRLLAVDKTLEEDHQWQRRIELKFAEYVTMSQMDRYQSATSDWRRIVDSQLTAAQSKSSVIYSMVAISISVGVLLVAVYNLFTKVPAH